MSLHVDWVYGKLEKEAVKKYLSNEAKAEGLELTDEELNHVARCCYAVYEWYDHDRPLGHFLTAVVTNDFMGAVGNADSTNKKCLTLYAKFLYNIAPADYRVKAKSPELWAEKYKHKTQ